MNRLRSLRAERLRKRIARRRDKAKPRRSDWLYGGLMTKGRKRAWRQR